MARLWQALLVLLGLLEAISCQVDYVGPPCSTNCLYAVQGNPTLQNISMTTATSISELTALNDAKYIPSNPAQPYPAQTICVSAKLCQDQSLIAMSSLAQMRTCDSKCQLITLGGNHTFAKAAEELTAAAKNRNSQATPFNAISAYTGPGPSFNLLLLLNPASDYEYGGLQTVPSPTCAPYTACRPQLECIVPISSATTAAQLSSYTSTPVDELAALNQDFQARLQSTALGSSLCIPASEGCQDQVDVSECITGCATTIMPNTTYRQLANSLPFPDDIPTPAYDSSGHDYTALTQPDAWQSRLNFLNNEELRPFLNSYNGSVDRPLPFESLCLPFELCNSCQQAPRLPVMPTATDSNGTVTSYAPAPAGALSNSSAQASVSEAPE